jgi:hypothetical protein
MMVTEAEVREKAGRLGYELRLEMREVGYDPWQEVREKRPWWSCVDKLGRIPCAATDLETLDWLLDLKSSARDLGEDDDDLHPVLH